jgi:RNA polymerase sigma factor (sigma-70 family)
VTDQTDEIIMQRVKDGNIEELGVLFERYNVRLFNFFLRLTMNRVISQDLTQNLFFRIIKYRKSYKNELSVKSWIYQMARNLHADYRNNLKKEGDLFTKSEVFQMDRVEDDPDYPEDDYERLEIAMTYLEDGPKELLVLSKYQGLKYEEIAVITNQSVPAIKVAVHRAVKQLRQIYFKQV